MPYIFDSNCFIEGWYRIYSPSIMPDYWELLSDDIKKGEIIFPKQVTKEINKKPDKLSRWLKNQKHILKLSREEEQRVEDIVQDITKKYPKILKHPGEMEADPYVIALARLKKGTVVTMERGGNRSGDEHKIPAVCREQKPIIKCVSPMQHIQERGWVFRSK